MINLLLIINKPIERANDLAGYIGRNLSIFAMGLMVVVILTQVYFRYVLNNALPWKSVVQNISKIDLCQNDHHHQAHCKNGEVSANIPC